MSNANVIDLYEIARVSGNSADVVIDYVEYGVLSPTSGAQPIEWQFNTTMVKRACIASRLEDEFNIQQHGLALTMDLLEEVKQLRSLVKFYKQREQQ